MKKSPTFEQLRVKRKLHVVNPDNGKRFTVSLRDWRECLWGIRVIPDVREPSDKFNGFVKSHRIMDPSAIEEWLGRLQLIKSRPAGKQRRRTAT